MLSKELISKIYLNATEVEFGNSIIWDENTFKSNWYHQKKITIRPVSGLYWIKSNFEITKFSRSNNNYGCNFETTIFENTDLLKNILCKKNEDDFRVVYNGQAENLLNRLRNHFVLKSPKTKALNLYSYPELSKYSWKVGFSNIDTIKQSTNITDIEKEIILSLYKSKKGRTYIEDSWRVYNGYPILCNN